MKRVVIVGTFLVLASALVFALTFSPTRSALGLANRGDEACVTEVRTEDDIRELVEVNLAKLEQAGFTREQAQQELDKGFMAAEEVISCPERSER